MQEVLPTSYEEVLQGNPEFGRLELSELWQEDQGNDYPFQVICAFTIFEIIKMVIAEVTF